MIGKCLFPVAGYGTRFLPATKSMPKEMPNCEQTFGSVRSRRGHRGRHGNCALVTAVVNARSQTTLISVTNWNIRSPGPPRSSTLAFAM